ncbi:MAG: general secretion pathway protein GspK [Phycisphaerae bacterium]|nr:general secretion pathway protein GspK [Phycisphaerae bacterium]
MNREIKSRRLPKAMVLVAVMWIVVLLTLIVTVVAQSGMLDTHIAHVSAERIRCKWACRAGLETAIAVLGEDLKDGDSLFDLWSENVQDFNSVPLDGCMFTVEIVDEAGKLNLNTATQEQLMYLPDMTPDIADGILDWRDGDDDVRESGAESGYYLNLPYGYEARNAGFKTVRELLRVRGVTPGLFYGDRTLGQPLSDLNRGWIHYVTCYSYDLNRDADGNARININSASESQLTEGLGISQPQARWIVENRTFNSIADLLTDNSTAEPTSAAGNQAQPLDVQTYYEIVDKVTVSDEAIIAGRVNINTACREVLAALLEGDDQVALDIIAYRQGLGQSMTSLGELKNIESMTPEMARRVMGSLTTRSNVYTVYSTATADATRITRKVEAVVDRDKSPAEVLYFRAGAIN